jgi:hypothetical protein
MSCLAVAAASPALADVPLPALAVKNARGELGEGRQIELDARVQYSGELRLYDSAKAMRLRLVYPYCISAGLAPNVGDARMNGLSRKRVRVSGTLLRYENAPDGPNTISTSTVIGGMFFKNWCFGPYVLRIEKLTIVE